MCTIGTAPGWHLGRPQSAQREKRARPIRLFISQFMISSGPRCVVRLVLKTRLYARAPAVPGDDLGLDYVHDFNQRQGHVCSGDWRSSTCWEPWNLERPPRGVPALW